MILMVKNNIKLVSCALLIGVFLSATTMMAYAINVYSSWKDCGTVYGYKYKNRASAYSSGTGSGSGSASVNMCTTDSVTVPNGYMGSLANVYSSKGQLLQSGQWFFYGSSTASLTTTTTTTYSGAICSEGETAAYNGSKYKYFTTYRSPAVNT